MKERVAFLIEKNIVSGYFAYTLMENLKNYMMLPQQSFFW